MMMMLATDFFWSLELCLRSYALIFGNKFQGKKDENGIFLIGSIFRPILSFILE
jgi:hypothetical protein